MGNGHIKNIVCLLPYFIAQEIIEFLTHRLKLYKWIEEYKTESYMTEGSVAKPLFYTLFSYIMYNKNRYLW